jgi:hypothetical protein
VGQGGVEAGDQGVEIGSILQHAQAGVTACRQYAGQRAEFLDQPRGQAGGACARYGLKESLQDLSAP